jgi:hypothetical protein
MVLVADDVLQSGFFHQPAVLEDAVLFGPASAFAARVGVVVQRDFEFVLFQHFVELARIAGVDDAPGRFHPVLVHHLQERLGQLQVVAVAVVRDVPYGFQAARPVPEHGQGDPLLPRAVQDAAQDDLAQFVGDRFQEDGRAVRLHRRAVLLPIQHQPVLGFQDPVVQPSRLIRRRLAVLKHGDSLLDVDDGEQQIRRQQDRLGLRRTGFRGSPRPRPPVAPR